MGNGKSKNFVFIANNSGNNIHVLIAPNSKWRLQKLLANFSEISISGLSNEIETIEDVWNIWKVGADSKSHQIKSEIFTKIHKLFLKHGMQVGNELAKNVYDTALIDPLDYLTSAGWAYLSTSQEFCITILLEDTQSSLKMTQFSTLEDWSWLVGRQTVTKTKRDSLWKPALESGYPYVTLKYELQEIKET